MGFFASPRVCAGFTAELEDVERGILVIELNRPQHLNGLKQGIKRDLVEVLSQAQMDNHVAVVVITGSGKAFSAGDDLNIGGRLRAELVPPIFPGHESPLGTYNGLRVLSQSLNLAVRNLDKLVVAAVQGYAIQTGFSLALAADFRIFADDAKVGSATLRFGLLPDEGGQYLLIQHLGLAGAMDFMMRKRIVPAEEALRLGLCHQVVPRAQLKEAAMGLARELAEGPQVAMRLLKRSIYVAAESGFGAALEDIATKTAIGDHHPDVAEGVRAVFKEKRPAKFNGWRQELPGVKARARL